MNHDVVRFSFHRWKSDAGLKAAIVVIGSNAVPLAAAPRKYRDDGIDYGILVARRCRNWLAGADNREEEA